MLYILWGEDEFSLHETLDEIKKKLGDPSMLSINSAVLEGQTVTINELKAVCETVPFLAEKRLVVITGLLERFEPKFKSGRPNKNSPKSDKEGPAALTGYLSSLPESTVVVLTDTSKIKPGNPLLKSLSNKAQVNSFPILRGDNLSRWIKECVAREGGQISPQAAGLLAELVGSNLRAMSNEIKKLILFTAGRPIGEEDVKKVASGAQESSVFALIDAIFDGRAAFAEQVLQQLLQSGISSSHILTMLSRQVRMIIQVKELKSQRKSSLEMQEKLGISTEFTLRRLLAQAESYSFEQLKNMHHELLETDLAIKTGKYDDELALDMMVAELCERHRAVAPKH